MTREKLLHLLLIEILLFRANINTRQIQRLQACRMLLKEFQKHLHSLPINLRVSGLQPRQARKRLFLPDTLQNPLYELVIDLGVSVQPQRAQHGAGSLIQPIQNLQHVPLRQSAIAERQRGQLRGGAAREEVCEVGSDAL